MAEAQYETRTRTVEETVIVLKLTEDEADELRQVAGMSSGYAMARVYRALTQPAAPETETAAGFEYAGEIYEYGIQYRDIDGDVFEFDSVLSTDGTNTPRGRRVYKSGERGDWIWSLAEVVDRCDHLTKVTA
ncbi:phiSA1p31-related protein [Streptomyces sp. NPDC057748]|uniref:phiSA1p31-related protein n=1 Tax=Streptomyces sp. NPDC057748 TaxID=3346239 RepID=UPI0036AD670F